VHNCGVRWDKKIKASEYSGVGRICLSFFLGLIFPLQLLSFGVYSLFAPPTFGSCSSIMGFLFLSLLLALTAVDMGDANRNAQNTSIGQPVGTSSGLVTGHPAPNASQVSEYLGIPYAQPPVGELRFASPIAYVNRDGSVDGSNFASQHPYLH